MTSPKPLPYEGIRVVEFTHMVMGPTCGMVLADMGAEVIKVEPVGHGREGDSIRFSTATKKAWPSTCKRLRAKKPHCA